MAEKAKPAAQSRSYEVHVLPEGIQQIHKNYGLWIIGGGNCTTPVNSYYNCSERYFEFYSISHMYHGAGRLWLLPGREFEVKAGQCVIIGPGTVNRYGGCGGRAYVEDSLCFTGPVADMMRHAAVIRDGVFNLGEARRLLLILKLAGDPAADSQINANIALQKLLVDIYNENKQQPAVRTDFVIDQLIAAIKEQIGRWWTVGEMADFCNLSDDQFRRLFLKRTGMLPKIYIDRLKIQKAAELLLSNRFRAAEIAEQLGYIDQYHFSRRFKKLTGLSPRRYRQTFTGAS
ncbi:MAG: AraC family transcriptional regulator [Victivallaceae bacterium]|nr:AraC family transcriptional regulator [Victivallaceae bacterium]